MFERFTERARQVAVLAQEEARNLRHNYVGTEHVLLGLLRVDDALASQVLVSLGMSVDLVRAQVIRIVTAGEESVVGQIPFTPRAKKVFELALREALSLGHNYIGTEHILLGLVREGNGVANRIMNERGAVAEAIRNEIIRTLRGSPEARTTRRFLVVDPESVAYVEAMTIRDAADKAMQQESWTGKRLLLVDAAHVKQFALQTVLQAVAE